MLEILTFRGATALKLEVGTTRKHYRLQGLTVEEFEATLKEAHDFHLELLAKKETTLVDLLFNDGVPRYIHLHRDNTRGKAATFQLQLLKNPVTGQVYERPVTASASISKYGIEPAFEVVWSKLELVLGLSELPTIRPLKGAMLAHFKKLNLYKIK